jgi:hypothetical protein
MPRSTAYYWIEAFRTKDLPKLKYELSNVGQIDSSKMQEIVADVVKKGLLAGVREECATHLPTHIKAARSIDPPTAVRVIGAVALRIIKYTEGTDIKQMRELIKHREQYSLKTWELVKGAIDRSIENLTALRKEMEE